jgi:LysM repeat protein
MHRHGSPSIVRLAALVALLAVGVVVVPAAATDRVVVVRQGDTLSEIALRHGVTVAQLMALNALTDPNRIFPGERLRLVADPAAQASSMQVATPIVHVVRSGEHLTGIAHRYGTTIAAIVQANGIKNPSYLRVGQRLVIPTGSPASAPTAAVVAPTAPIVHVVTSGETLTSISHRYGTTIPAIVQANGLSDASYLRVGQRLTIPGTSAPVVPGASMPAGMASLVRSRAPIGQIVAAEANAEGVPVAFALAVAWQESGWQAGVVSSAGAVGVMQLTKPTADWVARSMLDEPIKLTDPRSNVHAGIILLKHYLARYHGDEALVLAAYYQGQTAADQHGIYQMTRPYIASVLTLERYFTP